MNVLERLLGRVPQHIDEKIEELRNETKALRRDVDKLKHDFSKAGGFFGNE